MPKETSSERARVPAGAARRRRRHGGRSHGALCVLGRSVRVRRRCHPLLRPSDTRQPSQSAVRRAPARTRPTESHASDAASERPPCGHTSRQGAEAPFPKDALYPMGSRHKTGAIRCGRSVSTVAWSSSCDIGRIFPLIGVSKNVAAHRVGYCCLCCAPPNAKDTNVNARCVRFWEATPLPWGTC